MLPCHRADPVAGGRQPRGLSGGIPVQPHGGGQSIRSWHSCERDGRTGRFAWPLCVMMMYVRVSFVRTRRPPLPTNTNHGLDAAPIVIVIAARTSLVAACSCAGLPHQPPLRSVESFQSRWRAAKQRHSSLRKCLAPFFSIAELAGRHQIQHRVRAASAQRLNVVHNARLFSKAAVAAVLAAETIATENSMSSFLRFEHAPS